MAAPSESRSANQIHTELTTRPDPTRSGSALASTERAADEPKTPLYLLDVTCVDARLGARRIFWIGVARSRVRTCVRPLVRPITGRGPGWEFADQLQFKAARSKRFVTLWLS